MRLPILHRPRFWYPLIAVGVLAAVVPPALERATARAPSTSDYWDGVSRTLPTTPYGHRVGLSCHNCYRTTFEGEAPNTTTVITDAIAEGADFIELDVALHSDGILYVEHDESTSASPPRLSSVLGLPVLAMSDQLLFIEIKDLDADPVVFGRALLDTLLAAGYPRVGRPIVLRGFDRLQLERLDALRALLDTHYSSIEPLVRLQVLVAHVAPASPEFLRAKVDDAVARGYDGIEIAMTQPGLFSGIAHARRRGLGVSVYAVGTHEQSGHVFLAALRDEVDSVTTDYPMAGARALLEERNTLLHLDVADQTGSGGLVRYRREGPGMYSAAVGEPGAPRLVVDASPSTSLPGGFLAFAGREFLKTYDADNAPAPGYLVSASVDFDRLALEEGEKMALFSKAGGGAFSLDLVNLEGPLPTELRFGVHVGGGYRYSAFPAASLNLDDSFFIVGAYDGAGSVGIWVNGAPGAAASTAGSVTGNDAPAVIGAAPRGAAATRYFQGKLQHVLLQRWSPH